MDAAEFAATAMIATNLARHSRGVDRNDSELLASAYWPDATVAYGMVDGAAAEFVTFLATNMAGAPVTLHRTSNILARVDGDTARSETYVIAYLREPGEGGGTQRLIGGRYLDVHARRGREWRIAHRTYVMDWNMNAPAAEATMPGAAQGAQGAADPSAAHFAGLVREGGSAMDGLDEALAKQALHDLNATYARAVDRGDAELLASVFWSDAEVVTGVIDGLGPDYARDIVAMVRQHLRSCFHSISNEYVEVAGDNAVGESYVVAHNMTAAEDAHETLTGGRYLDRYERRNGRWRIAHRRFVYDWSITRPATLQMTGMYEHLPTRGSWAPDDPSVAFWADANA